MRQLSTTKKDGTLNRYLQAAAFSNGVQAFEQAYIKSYRVPNKYMVNGQAMSVVIAAGDTEEAPKRGLPLAVLIPSVVVGLLLLFAMIAFARQQTRLFHQQQEQLAVMDLAGSASGEEEDEGEGER